MTVSSTNTDTQLMDPMMVEDNNNSRMTEGNDISEDVLLGAYLIQHMRQHCENCGTLNTPQWRKGWFSQILNRSVLLCNACGLRYHKNQFCPYCRYVYGKETDKSSDKWLTCDTCGRWVHLECEKQYGQPENLKQLNYSCPDCKMTPTRTQSTIIDHPRHHHNKIVDPSS